MASKLAPARDGTFQSGGSGLPAAKLDSWRPPATTSPPNARFPRDRSIPAPAAGSTGASCSRPLGALALLIVKFGAKLKALLFLLPKIKIFTTSASMLVSIAAYSLIWGWKFAVGFVLLIFVHEMGHVLQLRREGIKASAPDVHPVPRRRDLGQVARRQRARGGARRPGRPDARQPRRGRADPGRGRDRQRPLHRRWPSPASSSTSSTCCRSCRSTAAARWRRSHRGCGSSASPRWSRSRSRSPTRSIL